MRDTDIGNTMHLGSDMHLDSDMHLGTSMHDGNAMHDDTSIHDDSATHNTRDVPVDTSAGTVFDSDADGADRLDRDDPLRAFRAQFHIPRGSDGSEVLYFCGNSLGLQPRSVRQYVEEELRAWAELGVEGHARGKHPWTPYHELLTAQTARIVGALPEEVVTMNTLTVNLHLLMVSFYRPTTSRWKIIIEEQAFPSDQYAVASQLHVHGFDPVAGVIEIPRDTDGQYGTDRVLETIARHRDDAALLLLGGVNYYNGELFDIATITRAAREAGIVVGVDGAHAVGNVPLRLHDWDVDFAAWCSYKYLNAGPGSTAAAFVHARHARRTDLPRFAGWWGHDKASRFAMPARFQPIEGAEGWQLSNPSILPLAALRASLDLFDRAGMDALRRKSELLTGYLSYLLRQRPSPHWRIITPDDAARRGCQLSLRVSAFGRRLFDYLSSAQVVCDWREPDVVRVAPVPMYNSFTDVWRFAGLVHTFFAAIP
ncbi:MAG: kynureninase [Bacteroidota bacterium]|jgi:kynureninase|nr:kynureninase [Bacteroidota bacterium]